VQKRGRRSVEKEGMMGGEIWKKTPCAMEEGELTGNCGRKKACALQYGEKKSVRPGRKEDMHSREMTGKSLKRPSLLGAGEKRQKTKVDEEEEW